jgi:hypothetical protein
MILRPELCFPPLDEARVERLAQLAAQIDGAQPGQWEEELAEFNAEAGTNFDWEEFQGIYGGQDHVTWVRSVLAGPLKRRLSDITRAELIELARRVMAVDGAEHEVHFWLDMLALNIPDPRVSDLINWPGIYFGDGDNSREFTPEQVIDIALARAAVTAVPKRQ